LRFCLCIGAKEDPLYAAADMAAETLVRVSAHIKNNPSTMTMSHALKQYVHF
jgi:hypothetical protein